MRGVGIVTDASAHLLYTTFPGEKRVHILPLPIEWEGRRYLPPSSTLTHALPPTLIQQTPPRLKLPPPQEIAQRLNNLSTRYDSLLLLPMGSGLSGLFEHFAKAAAALNKHYPTYLIDTQTIGVGLGWLVHKAAALAEQGEDVFTILRHIRQMTGQIYTAMGVLSLTYLQHVGFLDPAQAIVGEMLNMYPVFILEDGHLAPLQKARSSRHLLDLLEEFTTEFSQTQHVVITHHPHYFRREALNLHDRLANHLLTSPQVLEMGTISTALFGPRTLGLHILAA